MLQRKIVVVGYRKGELLPPYGGSDKEFIRPIAKAEAEKILKYIKGKKPVKSEISVYEENCHLYFKHIPEKVEIVGSWLECCVKETADFFLRNQSEVLINPELVLSNSLKTKKEISDYLKSNLLLPSYQKRTCRKTKKGLVFNRH